MYKKPSASVPHLCCSENFANSQGNICDGVSFSADSLAFTCSFTTNDLLQRFFVKNLNSSCQLPPKRQMIYNITHLVSTTEVYQGFPIIRRRVIFKTIQGYVWKLTQCYKQNRWSRLQLTSLLKGGCYWCNQTST